MNDADKPELNPYESPREPEPLTTGQIVKRGIGLGALLILTPLAVGIAALVSCGATGVFVTSVIKWNWVPAVFLPLGWVIFLTPPALTFFFMLWLYWPDKSGHIGPNRRE
ncbi:MAG TPA: hypothetical protein VGI40_13460 [Pirellulaceae bacterium]|jgi:hypothetical protein